MVDRDKVIVVGGVRPLLERRVPINFDEGIVVGAEKKGQP